MNELTLESLAAQELSVDFLGRCGLKIHDTLTTMSLGRRWMSDTPRESREPIVYGLAGHSLS